MDEERDFVVFTDDEGNEFELDVIGYFDYKDDEYAILADCGNCDDCEKEDCDGCEEDEGGLYIMRIIVNEENNTEEFVPPADEDMDALIELAEQFLSEDCCGCDDEECDCHEPGCTCGCEDK